MKEIIRKLFATGSYYTIALRQRNSNSFETKAFTAEYVVPATRREWCADPFLAQDGEHTYLFYEKAYDDLGSIVVAEVQADCTLSEPTMLFGGGSHYSYPC